MNLYTTLRQVSRYEPCLGGLNALQEKVEDPDTELSVRRALTEDPPLLVTHVVWGLRAAQVVGVDNRADVLPEFRAKVHALIRAARTWVVRYLYRQDRDHWSNVPVKWEENFAYEARMAGLDNSVDEWATLASLLWRVTSQFVFVAETLWGNGRPYFSEKPDAAYDKWLAARLLRDFGDGHA